MNTPMSTPLPFQVGAVCNGYRIVRQLGKGGMGVALEAVQESLDRHVCLKFIRPSRFDNPNAQRLFLSEAKALARLNHPHILTIHDVGTFQGYVYLVMELVDGQPLNEYMADNDLGFDFVIDVLQKIGGAVSYVHENNILHRDIKPTNILVSKAGVPKLADFGVAKILNNDLGATDTGGVGTNQFAAPEVLAGKRYDHRADIYSMGVLTYFLMTGHLPQQGVRPSKVNTDLPPEVDRVILKALSPNPADRYELVKTFINDVVAVFYSSDYLRRVASGVHALPAEPSPTNPHGPPGPAIEDTKVSRAPEPPAAGTSPRSSALIPVAGAAEPSTAADGNAPPTPAPSRPTPWPWIVAGGVVVVGVTGWMMLGSGRSASPAIDRPLDPPRPTPTPIATTTPPTPTPPPAPVVEVSPHPWLFDGIVPGPSRRYAFLATSERGLYASTFAPVGGGELRTEVYFIDPQSGKERRLVSLPTVAERGISGLAVDEALGALFACVDSGYQATSAVHRFDLEGAPVASFGTRGSVVLEHRPLGCVLVDDTLYVLIDWGWMQALDARTGAVRGGPVEIRRGTFLRDLAVSGPVFAAYGNGTYVERRLGLAEPDVVLQLAPSVGPRATEGIGVNPATGEFHVRPMDASGLLSLRGQQRVPSPLSPEETSTHFADVAVATDGSTLYASDFLRQRLLRFRRVIPDATATPVVEAPWATYTAAAWADAISSRPTFVAVFHHDDSVESAAFRRRLGPPGALGQSLAAVPRLEVPAEATQLPDALRAAGGPALYFLAADGSLLARFAPASTDEEIEESMDLIEGSP